MLSDIFYWVVNMSILGDLTGCCILALRKIKRLPRFGIYLLWAVPLIRFWIPLGIANKLSLINLLSKITTRTVTVFDGGNALPDFTMTNSTMAANRYFPIVYKTSLLKNMYTVSSVIWIVVAILSVISCFLLYGFSKAETENAVHLKENIYQTGRIRTPAVYGILHPRILLPAAVCGKDIDYILAHERVHIKRRDNLLRMIAIVTACLHWFNPFVWIFIKYFFEDMELACDAKVIKNYSEIQRKEYAGALLAFASAKKAPFVPAFGSSKTKSRIENIVTYRHLTIVSFMIFSLLVSALAIVLLTNAVS